jgi:histidyl-tRNA synthetase
VFEVVSPELGAGTVLCGGGRYDRLISDLGGPAIPGVGFAIGEDRLVEVLPKGFAAGVLARPRLLLVGLGDRAQDALLALALACQREGVPVELELGGRSLKAALRRADKDGMRAAAILGDDELAAGEITVRDLGQGAQQSIPAATLPAWWHALTKDVR